MKPRLRASGRALRLPPGAMNKTEQERARELDTLLAAGSIITWRFEPFRMRIADDNAFYTPDFMVVGSDGLITIEEIKGHWEEAALVRIKVAASLYPFRFVALRKRPKRDGGGWECRTFKGWSDDAEVKGDLP